MTWCQSRGQQEPSEQPRDLLGTKLSLCGEAQLVPRTRVEAPERSKGQ